MHDDDACVCISVCVCVYMLTPFAHLDLVARYKIIGKPTTNRMITLTNMREKEFC
jgi:hypothetical protein